MLNRESGLLGPLEQSILECFWAHGPQTSRQILTTLRKRRTIAHSTVTSTLGRLYAQGLLDRELIGKVGRQPSWRYTARYATRGALLVAVFDRLATQIAADHLDRAEALGLLLGLVR